MTRKQDLANSILLHKVREREVDRCIRALQNAAAELAQARDAVERVHATIDWLVAQIAAQRERLAADPVNAHYYLLVIRRRDAAHVAAMELKPIAEAVRAHAQAAYEAAGRELERSRARTDAIDEQRKTLRARVARSAEERATRAQEDDRAACRLEFDHDG